MTKVVLFGAPFLLVSVFLLHYSTYLLCDATERKWAKKKWEMTEIFSVLYLRRVKLLKGRSHLSRAVTSGVCWAADGGVSAGDPGPPGWFVCDNEDMEKLFFKADRAKSRSDGEEMKFLVKENLWKPIPFLTKRKKTNQWWARVVMAAPCDIWRHSCGTGRATCVYWTPEKQLCLDWSGVGLS